MGLLSNQQKTLTGQTGDFHSQWAQRGAGRGDQREEEQCGELDSNGGLPTGEATV